MIHKRVNKILKDPKKGLLSLSFPILISMFTQTLYNITDTAFIGHIGAEAIAALTFAFPIFFIIIAINAGLGAGVSSRISRFLGEKQQKKAENTAIHGIIISLVLGFFFILFGSKYIRQIFIILGAEGEVLEMSIAYMSVIFFGVFFMLLVGVFANIFTAQGDTKTSTKIYMFSIIINIILDPIFIYVLNLGVKGAAIATVIAYAFGFILAVYYLIKTSLLRLRISSFKFSYKIIKDIFFVGFPASLTMLTLSISVIFINLFLSDFSVNHIAAFGIAFRLETVAVMPVVALSLGVLPVTGMLFGAKKYDQLKEISFYAIKIGVIFSILIGIIVFLIPSLLFRIFTTDSNIISLGSNYLRVAVFYLPLAAVSQIISRVIQGTGRGLPGFLIILTRSVIVPITLSYLLIFILGYGYLAIPFSIIVGCCVSSFIAVIWLEQIFKNLKNK